MRGESLALYTHWSPDGSVSPMVIWQLSLWRQLGFDVVFVSNAEVPEHDWQVLGEQVVLRIARKNTGLDFGAWRDAAALAVGRYGVPRELLLANDSVLGPIVPLDPLVATWRAGGDGLFGMTENWGGGPHLQSYALLARGKAVPAVLGHLQGFRDHRSKWRVVQDGEIGLSRRLLGLGIRRAALFGYPQLCAKVDDATRLSLGPRFAEPAALLRYPLNPTHHLWRVLISLGFPYLKRELVMRNPGQLPEVDTWPRLVPPRVAELIQEHLAIMRASGKAPSSSAAVEAT
jgi:hypothetical protein